MATYNQEIKNMKLISHHDLNGFGNAGEGVALQQLPDGRRIFRIAHESAPKDVTALDVSAISPIRSSPLRLTCFILTCAQTLSPCSMT